MSPDLASNPVLTPEQERRCIELGEDPALVLHEPGFIVTANDVVIRRNGFAYQRLRGQPRDVPGDEQGDGPCASCGHPANYGLGPDTYWFADNELWNTLGVEGVLCPRCFTRVAAEKGVGVGWRVGRVGMVEDVPGDERLRAALEGLVAAVSMRQGRRHGKRSKAEGNKTTAIVAALEMARAALAGSSSVPPTGETRGGELWESLTPEQVRVGDRILTTNSNDEEVAGRVTRIVRYPASEGDPATWTFYDEDSEEMGEWGEENRVLRLVSPSKEREATSDE